MAKWVAKNLHPSARKQNASWQMEGFETETCSNNKGKNKLEMSAPIEVGNQYRVAQVFVKHKHGHKAKDFKTTCAFQHFLLQMTLGEAILGFPTNSPNESLRKSHILGGKAWILSQKTINCSSYLGFLEPSGRGAKLKPQ